jgi:hypothetical protein
VCSFHQEDQRKLFVDERKLPTNSLFPVLAFCNGENELISSTRSMQLFLSVLLTFSTLFCLKSSPNNLIMNDSDVLWDDLNLGGLVNSMKPVYNLSDKYSIDQIEKSKILKKHQDIVQKPTYNAIMGRYGAQPNKPKSIHSKKLDLLADPIKGRFSRIEKYTSGSLYSDADVDTDYASSVSPTKKSIRLNKEQSQSPKASAKRGVSSVPSGFFLTGGDDNGEPDNDEDLDRNYHSSKVSAPAKTAGRHGLAANLRQRVSEAQKRSDPLRGGGRANNRKVPADKAGGSRRGAGRTAKNGWTDNSHVDYLGKSKGFVRGKGSRVGGEIAGGEVPPGASRGSRKGIPSSGYGYKKQEPSKTKNSRGAAIQRSNQAKV